MAVGHVSMFAPLAAEPTFFADFNGKHLDPHWREQIKTICLEK